MKPRPAVAGIRSQQDAGDRDQSRPVAVEERAHRGDAHPERHERRCEPQVEEACLPDQLSSAGEGVGEEGRQEQGAARAQEREHPAEERREKGDLDHLRTPVRPLSWPVLWRPRRPREAGPRQHLAVNDERRGARDAALLSSLKSSAITSPYSPEARSASNLFSSRPASRASATSFSSGKPPDWFW